MAIRLLRSVWLAATVDLGFGLIGIYGVLVNGVVHVVAAAVSRRYNPGLVRGTAWFLYTALYQTSRGLVYLLRGIRTNTEART